MVADTVVDMEVDTEVDMVVDTAVDMENIDRVVSFSFEQFIFQ